MDEQIRRAWSRPELIVLVRSGADEAVLEFCKGGPDVGGPNATTSACDRPGSSPGACYASVGS